MHTQLGIAVLLLIAGAIVGICVGWAMRRDDSHARVEANRRYYEAQLAELAAQLQLTQPAAAPATTVVQHFHMSPGYPVPVPAAAAAYLEPPAQLELTARDGGAA